METSLKIGQLAAEAGVSAKAVRFYERSGVLPPPARGTNRYRLYGRDAVDRLRFVKQATGLGLTLAEVREIVTIWRGGQPPCRHVRRLLQEKAGELDRKLNDLLTLRRRIRQSLATWKRKSSGTAAVCPHIEAEPVNARRPVLTTGRRRRSNATARASRRRDDLHRL